MPPPGGIAVAMLPDNLEMQMHQFKITVTFLGGALLYVTAVAAQVNARGAGGYARVAALKAALLFAVYPANPILGPARAVSAARGARGRRGHGPLQRVVTRSA